MEQSDEVLLSAHLQGNQGAFEELVRRYGDSLLRYLLRMCGNQPQAEDLFQETFSRVHEKARMFKGRGRFKSWLYSIATNVTIDVLRKRNRRPAVIALDQEDDCCPTVGTMPADAILDEKGRGPLQMVVLEEHKTQVQQALERLPERQRTTLVLAYYQGMTYREVAETLGCSLGTVKSHMFRALRTLAGILPEIEGGLE